MSSDVLISWVAVNNDPFEGKHPKQPLADTPAVMGPTLTLLFDADSPYRGTIGDVVLLHRQATMNSKEQQALRDTEREIKQRCETIDVHHEPWQGDDPTDHNSIFGFLKKKMLELRRWFAQRHLIIHVSPGTPSMQTIWVLMGETGFIEPPFTLVKSLRKNERGGRPAVVPIKLDIETFYKAYTSARPRQVASEEQRVLWNPTSFRTERMKQLFAEARRFAGLNVPVLLLGERGTGKTMLASWIRLHSPFRRKTQDAHWPAVACGQYSPETMRAELFGYKKGSFTGATQDKEGLLQDAHGDTLFLDEVGDVSRDLQRLLIKALEEKEYMPLGSVDPCKSDFRLLTATNIDSSELRERLDADFLDRISYLELRLPPLREIRGELPWLWQKIYEQAVRQSGLDGLAPELGTKLNQNIVAAFERHPLSGNLRDLFKVAYRLLAAPTDEHGLLNGPDAVDYAFDGLTDGQTDEGRLSKAVARAFANDEPLDDAFDACGRQLPTKSVQKDLKSYMGRELRRIATKRKLDVEGVSDVTARALSGWKGGSK